MPIECQVIPDPLTPEEQAESSRLKQSMVARSATCTKCNRCERAIGKTHGIASHRSIIKLAESCPDGRNSHAYIVRRVPPGVDMKTVWTDGKLYPVHLHGWTVYSGYGAISKACPIKITAQAGCDPDVHMVNEFARKLAGKGYKVLLFENERYVEAPPVKPRKKKAKAKQPAPKPKGKR